MDCNVILGEKKEDLTIQMEKDGDVLRNWTATPSQACRAPGCREGGECSIDRGNYQGRNNFNSMGQRHPDFLWSSPGGSRNSPYRKESKRNNKCSVVEKWPSLKDPIAKQKGEVIERQVDIVEAQNNNENQESEVRVDLEDGLKKKKTRAPKKKTRALKKKKKNKNSMNEGIKERKYMPLLPFPQKQRREKLETIWALSISAQAAYAKFLTEILSNKKKVEETSVVKLTEYCSAILQNNLPYKCGDLGSFTIPCSLGSTNFEKSLCDSGAFINLMPLSIFRKIERDIGTIKYVLVSLQLADQTTIIPEGIVEDVLVQVDKFAFPVDFIVINMEENKEVPLILGRPFLATGRAILDIQERQLMLRVGEERVVFKMKEAIGTPRDELTTYSKFKAKALKEQDGEGKHDKCGVYPNKSEKKISAWYCALGQVCKVDPDIDSDRN
nr:uncharacterized protein LOC104121369 [Nicotiana tomentosiformis]